MTSSSTGSTVWPPICFVTMSGRDTCSSKPSRRIISIRIDSCSSPRPTTFICSGVSVGSTRMETFPSSSLSSRSFIWRDVTYCPSRPGHRRGVHAEDHRHGRLVDGDRRDRELVLHVGDRLANRDVLDAREADDVACGGLLDVHALQPVEGVELRHLRVLNVRVQLAHRHRVADLHAAVEDAADGDAAEVVARVEVRDEQLQRRVRDCRAAAARARRSRRRAAGDPRRRRPGRAWRCRSCALV